MPPKQPPLDPRIIDAAPIAPDVGGKSGADLTFVARVVALSQEVAERDAELERLRGQQTADDVKARMLEPFANKVFTFVVWYCVAVGILLLLSGWKGRTGFALSDAILGIVAGSTAVSVIGLIGMVISGLFGARTRNVKKASTKKPDDRR